MPNTRILLSSQVVRLLICCLILLPSAVYAGLSGNYTINPALATGGNNYQTFTAAVSALSTNGVSGPVVFTVSAGTYTESFTINSITGASAINTVTFQGAENDSTAVIVTQPASATSTTFVVKLSGAQYVTLRKMTFQRTANSTYTGMRLVEFGSGSNYNQLRNCRLLGLATTTAYSDQSTLVANKTGLDLGNKILNCYLLNGSAGIYWDGPTATPYESGTQIEGNTLVNQSGYGIYLRYQTSPSVRRNNISTTVGSSSYQGISCNTISVTAPDRFYVAKNIVVCNAATVGINFSSCNGVSGTEGVVADNFVQCGTGSSATNVYGLSLSSSNYLYIVYNTVNQQSSNASTSPVGALYLSATGNLHLWNNILAATSGSYAIYSSGSTMLASSDYNCLYSSGSNVAYQSGTKTFAAWQALGKDAHSFSIDPQFASSTNYTINATGLRQVGSPIANGTSLATLVPDDIEGRQRSTSTPDIGCFEISSPDSGSGGSGEPDGSGSSGGTSPANLFPQTGNVGIGTSSPLASLDVNGGAWVHSTLRVGTASIYIEGMQAGTPATGQNRISTFPSGAPTSDPNENLLIETKGALLLNSSTGTGNVGIGIANPAAKLHVSSNIRTARDLQADGSVIVNYTDNGWGRLRFGAPIIYPPADGLPGTIEDSREGIGSARTLYMPNYHGLDFYTDNEARMQITNDGNIGIGTDEPQAKLHVNGNVYFANGKVGIGTATPQAPLHVSGNAYFASGNVGIGTAPVSAAKLSVSGNVLVSGIACAQEFHARLNPTAAACWPDYVFSPDYNLPTLDSLQRYLQTERHLPGMPTANTAENEGFDLGQNQVSMLENLERLTLYILELKRENTVYKQELTELRRRLEQLESHTPVNR